MYISYTEKHRNTLIHHYIKFSHLTLVQPKSDTGTNSLYWRPKCYYII